jgi:hypothetical protein
MVENRNLSIISHGLDVASRLLHSARDGEKFEDISPSKGQIEPDFSWPRPFASTAEL